METGERPESGLCAAVDVNYLSTGGARAAAVLAAGAAFAHVLAECTAVVPQVPPYRPGEFYRRELPPLRTVLEGLTGLGLLVVDGYTDLDPATPCAEPTPSPGQVHPRSHHDRPQVRLTYAYAHMRQMSESWWWVRGSGLPTQRSRVPAKSVRCVASLGL